jgi:hypothetical protein
MGEATMVDQLNAWGAARDQELIELRSTLAATQSAVQTAFDQAKEALFTIIADHRTEAATARQHVQYEAAQSVERLSLVVTEARARFDTQDVRFTDGLGELVRRQQALEAWARAEPARAAAAVQASAPTQPYVPTSPGGTPLTFYPSPGLGDQRLGPLPAVPTTPPPAHATARATPQAPAWDAWAAARPQQQPQPQPQQIPDPWAAAAAAPRHFDMSTPGGGGGGGKGGSYPYPPKEMRIDARSWGTENRKLDVATSFEGFQVWKDRAMMFLSRERPDIRKLLTWAEAQSKDSLEAGLAQHAAQFGVMDLAAAEYAIHDGIKVIILDSLLGRARNCVERGCELWRSLTAEWSGAAPQLKQAKARRYQEPPRCKDVTELWSRLPAWERLGEEVKLAGLDLPEWMRSAALEKLLPAQLLATLVARPELATYSARLDWVKTQMEHARGLAQATAFGPGVGKDASGDVYMNSLEAPPGFAYQDPTEGLAWALADSLQQGDWPQVESLQNAICALKGGKGGLRKGSGKGKPGKGAAGQGAAAPAAEFNGVCNHCGIWGHRRSDCRRLDKELAKAGGKGAKSGGKGGKGGPKGGKGPPAAPLAECAEEDDWVGELAGDGEAAEEWYFDSTLGSLTAEAPAWTECVRASRLGPVQAAPTECVRASRLGPVGAVATPHRHPAGVGCGVSPQGWRRAALEVKKTSKVTLADYMPELRTTKTQNRFSALSLLMDDADELLGAVSGEMRGGRVVEAVVDSGAVHSVTPPSLFPGRVCPSPWSRAGRGYRAANGTGIKNLGQVQVPFGTAEGHKCQIPFQVAEVEQPLLSVAHLTAAGNRVELGHTDGRVVNLSTGRTIALERRGGVYILRMFIADAAAPLPFRRQGA